MKSVIRRFIFTALSATLAFAGLGLATETSVSASSIDSLPDPRCSRVNGPIPFWRSGWGANTDCSARETWWAYEAVVTRGTPQQFMRITELLLAPASESSGTDFAGHVKTHAGSSRFCNALAINTFLSESARRNQLISNGRGFIADVLKIPSGRGTSIVKSEMKRVLPTVWNALASQAMRASAVSAVNAVTGCEARGR